MVYRGLSTWLAGQDPQDGIADWQLQGGLPGGLSGGALCLEPALERAPDWPLLGLLYLGGEGAATSRVIPAGVILGFLRRAAPDAGGRVRILAAATLPGNRGTPAADPGAWDHQRHRLRDLLVRLPAWKLVHDRSEFVETALGDHPAAAAMIWDDDPFTVAGNLVQRLKRFMDVPVKDGRPAVCALLAEVEARPWCEETAIGESCRILIEAFGCPPP